MDGWFLRGAPRGIGRYVRGLVTALTTIEGIRLFVLMPPGKHLELSATAEACVVEIPFSGPYPLWEQVVLPRAAMHVGADALHSPGNTFPMVRSVARVVTVMDLIYMDRTWQRSVSHGARLRGIYRSLVVGRGLRSVEQVICPTAVGADEIATRLHIRRDDIAVVGVGLDPAFQTITASAAPPLEPPFVLAIAAADPRKNLGVVVEAFMRAAQQSPESLTLAVVGIGTDQLSLSYSGRHPAVRALGFVNDETLKALYRDAACLVYVSRREGFGLPIIEAQSFGTPVIASDVPVLREVAGDGATFVEPNDVAGLAAAILRTWLSDSVRSEMASRARTNAARYSWDSIAQQLAGLYLAVADR